MKAKLLGILLGAVGPMILHIIQTLLKPNLLDQAIGLARLEVERLMGDKSLDNDTKRKMAVAFVGNQLKLLGTELADSMLNLAVELAVAAVKTKYGEK